MQRARLSLAAVLLSMAPVLAAPPTTQSATIAKHAAGVIARLARFHHLTAHFTFQHTFHHDGQFKEIKLKDGGIARPSADQAGEMHLHLLDGMGCWDQRYDAATAASLGIRRDVRISNGQRAELLNERTKDRLGIIMFDAGVAPSLVEVGLGVRRYETPVHSRVGRSGRPWLSAADIGAMPASLD